MSGSIGGQAVKVRDLAHNSSVVGRVAAARRGFSVAHRPVTRAPLQEARMSETEDVMEPRRWRKNGWVAQVMKNEDDDGWAVAMTRVGDSEPALVGPWTMGRDKKNPKPLDGNAFNTLVKTVNEVLRRHEQQAHAARHKSVNFIDDEGNRVRVDLDIAKDEDDPHALLTAWDVSTGEQIAAARVAPNWKLTNASAEKFATKGQP
jgi:hypothetical protein